MQKPKKSNAGRPSDFDPDMADKLLSEIATSDKSLRTICRKTGFPEAVTVMRWLRSKPEFCELYARAKQEQAEYMQEGILEIADDGSNDTYVDVDGNVKVDNDVIQRSRLRVETRKWLMSKLLPKKYGEKAAIEHSGSVTVPVIQFVTPPTFAQRRAQVERN